MDKVVQLELPVTHFHTVFTLPHELNELIRSNQKLCYNILFRAASKTLKELCAEKLNLLPGMLTVLHTWGQNLFFHPHIHCLIPNGGVDLNNKQWKEGENRKYLIRPRLLRAKFRKYFLHMLREAYENEKLEYHGKAQQYEHVENLRTLFETIQHKKWVVWNQPPAKGVKQIHEYLARYVHRVAIADSRISNIDNNQISFSYKDYRKEDGHGKPIVEEMTLPVMEFIRRFLLHVLPYGFMKTRYYGILSSVWRKKLKALQLQLNVSLPTPRTTTEIVENIIGHPLDQCPACFEKNIVTFLLLPSKGWLEKNCQGLQLKNRAPPRLKPNTSNIILF